ncbi:ATP-binding protein [Moritella sp. Urea-trap-13]|uniref:ATP-binding protein n=1 Tax=Moritella sp. Urea-trap-13 TaxID=2058327 RepID=UPI000C34715D|nr:ATP-binding protein [Moritella sp. Urea-trap-13]PKH05847.1 ATP-binding protein [Moritella sp. Urea-trap-13]
MKHHSLKSRLLFAAGGCCVVLILITGFTVQRYMQDYLRSELVTKLTLSLDELLSRLEVQQPTLDPTNTNSPFDVMPINALSEPRFSQPYSGFYWQIQTATAVLKRSRSLWETELTFSHLNNEFGLDYFVTDGPTGQALMVVQQKVKLPDSETFFWVAVAQESSSLALALQGVNRSLLIGLGLLALAVMLLILLQLTWGLRPLTTLRKELAEIENGDKAHFQHHYPQEIDPLVKDINRLLVHHQQLLEKARTNAGNMAHALKTPLSIMQNELALPQPAQKALLQQQLQQMRQHIEYHLSASQIAAKQLLGTKCSPYQQCSNAVSAFSRLYASRNIVVELSFDEALTVAVDGRDFDEMAGNLIENAYKWATSRIVISAVVVADQLQMTIADDGPGMSEADCQLVLDRGQRLDEQTPGHGLGLNIAAEMARMYQGKLTLQRASLGGLAAQLALPLRNRL